MLVYKLHSLLIVCEALFIIYVLVLILVMIYYLGDFLVFMIQISERLKTKFYTIFLMVETKEKLS